MKHFSKVLFSIQSDTHRIDGDVEKLELPKNTKDFQIEPEPVFRLFEFFDRADCVSEVQDESTAPPSLSWCWTLCSLSNAPAEVFALAARQHAERVARRGGEILRI